VQVWKRKEANKLAVNLGARSAEWQFGNAAVAPHDRRRARSLHWQNGHAPAECQQLAADACRPSKLRK